MLYIWTFCPVCPLFSRRNTLIVPCNTLFLRTVRAPTKRLVAFATTHVCVVKHVKSNARAVPCSFKFKLRRTISKVDQITRSQVLGRQSKLLKRFLKRIDDHLQPVLDCDAAFNTNRTDTHLHGFFNCIRQQFIIYLVGRRVSHCYAVHCRFTNTGFQRIVFTRCPAFYCFYQRVVLAFTKEVAETKVYANFVKQHPQPVALANVVGKQYRSVVVHKAFGVCWNFCA